jgi:transcriptional regulator with XRE-family HTH domain
MQALFPVRLYSPDMTTKGNGSHLRELREAAGLSLRELARQIGEQPSNVNYWETSGNLPRSDVVVAIAQALGVSADEVLGQPKPKRVAGPGGKARRAFEAVSKLPRRQQAQIIKVVEALVAQQANSKAA